MEIHPLGAELFRADEQTNKKKLRGGLSLQICVFLETTHIILQCLLMHFWRFRFDTQHV